MRALTAAEKAIMREAYAGTGRLQGTEHEPTEHLVELGLVRWPELTLADAGYVWCKQDAQRRAQSRINRRSRSGAMRSVGMVRNRNGSWE